MPELWQFCVFPTEQTAHVKGEKKSISGHRGVQRRAACHGSHTARCGSEGLKARACRKRKRGNPSVKETPCQPKAESARAQPAATDNFRRPSTDRYQQPVLATH